MGVKAVNVSSLKNNPSEALRYAREDIALNGSGVRMTVIRLCPEATEQNVATFHSGKPTKLRLTPKCPMPDEIHFDYQTL